MPVTGEERCMTDRQIDTIILAAFVSKQQVTITLINGERVCGFISSDFDEDGFSLTDNYVWWKDIQFVRPEEMFYTEWSEVFKTIADPFSTEVAGD